MRDVANQATNQGLCISLLHFDAPDKRSMGCNIMVRKKETSRDEDRRGEEFHERFRKALAERPEMSDKDFMAETEVSDEQYALGLVLPVMTTRKEEPDE